LTGTEGASETARNETKPRRNETKPKRNGRLRFGPRKSLIWTVGRNRSLRRLLSFQCVEDALRREARFAARERRRAADATEWGATKYDTDHSDFQEAIVAATACVNLRRHCASVIS
jgi:hypothetical protein